MITGDGSYIRQLNRGLILSEIIKKQSISRADLAKVTGLNKATISTQVNDLIDDELVIESRQKHSSIGRRPILLSLNPNCGYVLGINLDYQKIEFVVANLLGKPIIKDTINIHTVDYHLIINLLIEKIKFYQNNAPNSRYNLISVVIGIHGTVNQYDQSVLFVPKYNWRNKDIRDDIKKEINIPVFVDNNANLSIFAENVYCFHDAKNIININLSSGIGAGILIDGKIHRGFDGYAGEIGHIIVEPDGKKCRCGNKGCWELYAAEPVLLSNVSKRKNQPINYNDLEKLILEKDKIAIQETNTLIEYLSQGINDIINIFNPEIFVLTSKILTFYPNSIEHIKENLYSSVSQYRKIVLSTLGNSSCVLGACAFAIKMFLQVPRITLKHAENESEY